MRSPAAAVHGTLMVRVLAYATAADFGPEDPGTRPLAGCRVSILTTPSVEVATGTPEATGEPRFSVLPGRFTVVVTPPEGYEEPGEQWVDGLAEALQAGSDVLVAAGRITRIGVRMRPRPGAVTIELRIADPREDLGRVQGAPVAAWQQGTQVDEAYTDHDGECTLTIGAPGVIEVRPVASLARGGWQFVPDRPSLVVVVPPGADVPVDFTYLPAPAEVRIGATLFERSAEGEGSRPLAGVRFDLTREDAEGAPVRSITTGVDPTSRFPGLDPGRYVLTITPPAGVHPRPSTPLPPRLHIQLEAGQIVDLEREFVFEPVDLEGIPGRETHERSARTDSLASTPPPSDRRSSMPEAQEPSVDRPAAGGDLATMTFRIQFPQGAAGFVATDTTGPQGDEHLEGEDAVAHLLNVDMRGELESRIQDEARQELGVEDVKVELLMVGRGSIEAALAVFSAVVLTVKNADEIIEASERLFRRALGAIRWVIQRMPRTGPLPTHVVTGYWTPGAAMPSVPRQPAAPAGGQPAGGAAQREAVPGPPPQVDSDQPAVDHARRPFRLIEPASLLAIYLLLINLALIATLIVMVFRQS